MQLGSKVYILENNNNYLQPKQVIITQVIESINEGTNSITRTYSVDYWSEKARRIVHPQPNRYFYETDFYETIEDAEKECDKLNREHEEQLEQARQQYEKDLELDSEAKLNSFKAHSKSYSTLEELEEQIKEGFKTGLISIHDQYDKTYGETKPQNYLTQGMIKSISSIII